MHSLDDPLLYCPLDLPPPPTVTADQLYGWFARVSTDLKMKYRSGEDVQTYGCQYEEPSDYGRFQGPVFLEEAWLFGFDKEFPELAAYLDLFPVENRRIAIYMTCPEVESFEHELLPHFDIDEKEVAFRAYLLIDPTARLYFTPIKPSFRQFYKNKAGVDIPKHHLMDAKVYANTLPTPHAWVIGNQEVAHGVAFSQKHSRCVVKLQGTFKDSASALIGHSRIKYDSNLLTVTDVYEQLALRTPISA